MAKILLNESFYSEAENKEPPDRGMCVVACNRLDRAEIEEALKKIGIQVVTHAPRVIAAMCDVELDTSDLKHLKAGGELILVTRPPFSIYLSCRKTSLDYLEENPLPHQQGNPS